MIAWIGLGIVIGFSLGMMVGGGLAAGRVSDLESEVFRLRAREFAKLDWIQKRLSQLSKV